MLPITCLQAGRHGEQPKKIISRVMVIRAGKPEGMDGAKAPVMWGQGAYAQKKVLEYVEQDARTTARVYEEIVRRRHLPWTSRSGKSQSWRWDGRGVSFNPAVGERLLSVSEALRYVPKPDTSWMTDPRSRESFYAWTNL